MKSPLLPKRVFCSASRMKPRFSCGIEETEHGRGDIAGVHLDLRMGAVGLQVLDVGRRERHVQRPVFFVVDVRRIADAVDAEAVAAVDLPAPTRGSIARAPCVDQSDQRQSGRAADFLTAGGNSLALGSTSGGLTVNAARWTWPATTRRSAPCNRRITGVACQQHGPRDAYGRAGNAYVRLQRRHRRRRGRGLGQDRQRHAHARRQQLQRRHHHQRRRAGDRRCRQSGQRHVTIGAGTLQTTGTVALDNATHVTDAGQHAERPVRSDT